MNYRYTYLFLILFLCLLIPCTEAQISSDIKHETLQKDSIVSEKGQLQLLTQRIYLAFKAYTTGMSGFTLKYEVPVMLKYNKDISKCRHMNFNELNKIPIDSIESIEAVYEPKYRGLLYGLIGQRCIIIIKIKGK